MLRKIKSRLTMKRKSLAFVDVVSGKSVYIYEDCFGVLWLAEKFYLTSMRVLKSKP